VAVPLTRAGGVAMSGDIYAICNGDLDAAIIIEAAK
jgi:hypothetical protein